MEQFLIIVTAHFLALLSPGPDFFLIIRTSLSHGWKVASSACVGIAVANGVFIVMAFAGLAILRADSALFVALQLAGCAYLLYLGVIFVRHAGANTLAPVVVDKASGAIDPMMAQWPRAMAMGFLSGILNPKNALFYVSLAAMLNGRHATAGWKMAYGVWMFSAVLLWDVFVAVMMGNQTVLRRFSNALPWFERLSGVALCVLALSVLGMMVAG